MKVLSPYDCRWSDLAAGELLSIETTGQVGLISRRPVPVLICTCPHPCQLRRALAAAQAGLPGAACMAMYPAPGRLVGCDQFDPIVPRDGRLRTLRPGIFRRVAGAVGRMLIRRAGR